MRVTNFARDLIAGGSGIVCACSTLGFLAATATGATPAGPLLAGALLGLWGVVTFR